MHLACRLGAWVGCSPCDCHAPAILLELERQIVALDAAAIEAGAIWDESQHVMFAWERRNPELKEKKTARPKLGPDPDVERDLCKYGDRISRLVRDILPTLMETSADRQASAESKGNLHSGMNSAAPLALSVVMRSISSNLSASLTKLTCFARKPPACADYN